jgi:hypothetical protein
MSSQTKDKQQPAQHVDDEIDAPKVEKATYKSQDSAEKPKKEHNSDVEKDARDAYSQSIKK